MNTSISGVMANYLAMNNLDDFQLGDGLNQNDLDTQARVTVLGAGIASDLFGTEFPIGKQIRINGFRHIVVHPGGQAFIPIALHGVRGHGNDRHLWIAGVAAYLPGGMVAGKIRQL